MVTCCSLKDGTPPQKQQRAAWSEGQSLCAGSGTTVARKLGYDLLWPSLLWPTGF